MTYLSNITEYVRQLCREHVSLRHDVNGVAFVSIYPGDETAAVIPNIKQRYVKMVDVSTIGSGEEAMTWIVVLEFLKNVPATNTQREVIEEAWNEMQEIMLDFDARIRQDAEDDDKCFFANNLLQPGMELRERIDQYGFGWSYTWRFTADKKRHDPARWV